VSTYYSESSQNELNFQKNSLFSKVFEDDQGSLYLCKAKKCNDLQEKYINFVGKGLDIICAKSQIKKFQIINICELQNDLEFDHDLKKWNLDDLDEKFFDSIKKFKLGEKYYN
jgi:hypothetical protein